VSQTSVHSTFQFYFTVTFLLTLGGGNVFSRLVCLSICLWPQ